MAQSSPDFARIASRMKLTTSTDRRVLLQHYSSLTLIAIILTGLVLFIVRIPRAHAVGVQAATEEHSTLALRESLHDLHNPNNDNWHHAALPVLVLFLSVMGFGVLFTLAILILPYCVKGAEARLSYLGDAMTSAVTTTTARMPTPSSLARHAGFGYNDTHKSGPTCYTPTCEYKPDSMASRIVFPGGLNPLYVAGLICFLWWAAPRFWKAIAMDGQQASSGPHAATLAREEKLRYADDSFGDCLCGQCLSKLCADCLVKVKRHSVETSSGKDDETVDDDEVEDGWYDVANDSEAS
ncbi:hypothetical protein LTR91_013873 [Friedmanniomyces endolithicus]|uniref:Uncharacterized protein n=1 Tax=Friedmanniomyces endolithicus TaxID=329885 RepID=A0AAN6QP28_9PEZI|nr:hypothetical protein LTR38_013742 [Friedmanniomyces endolithicus]KAK0784042.1 hypothetical protein LTR59_011589 [Friedmanniomyces endolithicus]KAK0819028.1 hypothetical protein LTR75_002484 [Friedmanniomyces endolithicus]KAK0847207.1 hypothetical protein LTS02_014562 [Friedmanniomyces endolithicus]KAK0851269.1 hypothetical protein LTR03_004056 [Friedmanniomyces endolithicus]